jgi:hypothetical protein
MVFSLHDMHWLLVACADNTAYKSTDDGCAKCYPSFVMATMMMYFMMFMVMLRCMMSWCMMMLYGLMPWGMMWNAPFASMWSSHGWPEKGYTSKSENHQLFESFVHSTPSLSFLF